MERLNFDHVPIPFVQCSSLIDDKNIYFFIFIDFNMWVSMMTNGLLKSVDIVAGKGASVVLDS